jgi:cell wall-associated NlpC family hydrolase
LISRLSDIARHIALILLGATVGALVVVQATPTASFAAFTFNRTNAAAYASKYACNNNEGCRNASYVDLGDVDCTNFVSQALRAGGMTMKRTTSLVWWYDGMPGFFPWETNRSSSWSGVSDLRSFLIGTDRGNYSYPSMSASTTSAAAGDIYMYDWGKGEGYSHMSVALGSGTFASFRDPKTGRFYSSVTSGFGSMMAQHSTDRNGAPWNWGFQTERDMGVRAKMDTIVIRINPGAAN